MSHTAILIVGAFDLNYDILRKGVCSFNAGDCDPSKCSCQTGMPIPGPESPDTDKEEKAYFRALEVVPNSKEPWNNVDELEEFLLEYKMGRVMPPPGKRKQLLSKSIYSVRQQLQEIRAMDLLGDELSKSKKCASEIYASINSSMKTRRITENATLVAKVMHILQPKLFVILDAKIRTARGLEWSFDDYWKYLEFAQQGLRETLEDYRRVSNDSSASSASIEKSIYRHGWKPITKLYDEACWAMVQGWLHFC